MATRINGREQGNESFEPATSGTPQFQNFDFQPIEPEAPVNEAPAYNPEDEVPYSPNGYVEQNTVVEEQAQPEPQQTTTTRPQEQERPQQNEPQQTVQTPQGMQQAQQTQSQTIAQQSGLSPVAATQSAIRGEDAFDEAVAQGLPPENTNVLADSQPTYNQYVGRQQPFHYNQEEQEYEVQDRALRNGALRAASRTEDLGVVPKSQVQDLQEASYEVAPNNFDENDDKHQSPKPIMEDTPPSYRFFETRKIDEKKALRDIQAKVGRGQAVLDDIIGNERVRPEEISVGSDLIVEAIRQPGCRLLDLINNYTGDVLGVDTPIEVIAEVVNRSRFKVITAKAPVSDPASSHTRILRVHEGRGIKIHPTQLKMYNADTDGDKMLVQFNWASRQNVPESMTFMIGIDGTPNIDPAFFPFPELSGTREQREYLRSNIVANNMYIDKLIEISQDTKNMDKWRELILLMYDIAQTRREPNKAFSDLLYRTYNTMKELRMFQENASAIRHGDSGYVAPLDDTIRHVVEHNIELAERGEMPNNSMDWRVAHQHNIYEIENSNALWRDDAGVGKKMRRSQRISFGTQKVNGSDRDINDVICEIQDYTVAKVISNRASMGGRERFEAEQIRDRIIQEVGMPSDYPSLIEFFDAFIPIYEREQALVNVANVGFRTDYGAVLTDRSKNLMPEIHADSLKSVTSAFIRIYGDKNLRTLFSRPGVIEFRTNEYNDNILFKRHMVQCIDARNQHRTLRQLAQFNEFYLPRTTLKDIEKLSYKDKTFQQNEGELVYDIILLAADKRRGAASRYNRALTKDGAFDIMKKCVEEIQTVREATPETANYRVWLDSQLQLLEMIHPDMFYYYHMDCASTFMNNKYAQQILDAKSTEEIGSIWAAMVFEYRLAAVSNSARAIRVADVSTDEYAQAVNRHSAELDKLADSSDVWRTIVHELRAKPADSYLKGLKDNLHVTTRTRGNQRIVNKTFSRDGREYRQYYDGWANDQHKNLKSILLDTKLSYSDKMSMVADVVRYATCNMYFSSYEVAYNMVVEPRSKTTSRILTDDGGMFDTLLHMSSANNHKSVSYQKALEQVRRAKQSFYTNYYKNNKNRNVDDPLETLLYNFSKNRSFHVAMNQEIFTEAVLSSLDVNYGNTEKSRQQAVASALYQGISLQRAGRITSDMNDLDDRLLMIKSYRDLTIYDIVDVLASSDSALWIYDEFGTPIKLTREYLCGGNSIGDVWNFFERYPFIAMALRHHHVNAFAEAKHGKAFLSADWALGNALYNRYMDEGAVLEEVRSHMEDHPHFGALVGLLLNVRGQVSRNLSVKTKQVENNLIRVVCDIARRLDEHVRNGTQMNLTGYIEHNLDISIEKMVANGCDENEATRLFGTIYHDLVLYAQEAAQVFIDNRIENNIHFENGSTPGKRIFEADLSLQDIAMYYHVKQSLSGAKTEVSTSIEGFETKKLAVWIAALDAQDSFDNLAGYTAEEAAALLEGGMLSDGTVLTAENAAEIVNNIPEGEEVMIEVPEGRTIYDPTLDDFGNQISALNRHILIKREKGAEKFNLKAKKLGDDGLDSVSKMRPAPTQYKDYEELLATLRQIDANQGFMAAKQHLASYLKAENEKVGYNDLALRDYMNIANYMLIKNDEGEMALRSITQIATAIKNRMPAEFVNEGSIDDIQQSAQEISKTVGFGEYNGNPVDLLAGIGIKGNSDYSPLIRERSSSVARNYDLLEQISHQTGIRPATHTEIYGRDWDQEDFSFAGDRSHEASDSHTYVSRLSQNETYREFMELMQSNRALRDFDVVGVAGYACAKTIGPKSMWIIDEKELKRSIEEHGQDISVDEFMDRYLQRAYDYGITVVFRGIPNAVANNPEYLGNVLPLPGGNGQWNADGQWYILPFFDMRLNGMYSDAMYMGSAGTFTAPEDNIVYTVEDRTGYYAQWDAGCVSSKKFWDNVTIDWSDDVSRPISDLFVNAFEQHPTATFEYELASADEIENILRYRDQDRGEDTICIDYGLSTEYTSNTEFMRHKEQVDKLIDKYDANFSVTNGNGILMDKTVNAEDIIGWAKLHVIPTDGRDYYVYAPLMLYQTTDNSMTVPRTYEVTTCSADQEGSTFRIGFKWSGDPRHAHVKVYLADNASNKFMTNGYDAIDMGEFRNGIPVHLATSAESSASRRLGEEARLSTLETMMYAARQAPYGFNYAEHSSSFPNNPDLKDRLMQEPIPIGEWRDILENDPDFAFSNNEEINAFLRPTIKLCLQMNVNPSDFLASRFHGVAADRWFEFRTVMNRNLSWQNGLMNFYHMMMPTICPDNVDNRSSEAYLFCPSKDEDIMNCLQMEVPYQNTVTKNWYYSRQNVYAGFAFFGDEFSGFHMPNVNGSSRNMDQLNAYALAKRISSERDFRKQLKWAWSDTDRTGTYAVNYVFDPEKTEQQQGMDADKLKAENNDNH